MLRFGVDGKGRKRIPVGSLTWKQGWDWKYIPPPYNQLKPISLGNTPPSGAVRMGKTPFETLQIIGKAKARVRSDWSPDTGTSSSEMDRRHWGPCGRFLDVSLLLRELHREQEVVGGKGSDTDPYDWV